MTVMEIAPGLRTFSHSGEFWLPIAGERVVLRHGKGGLCVWCRTDPEDREVAWVWPRLPHKDTPWSWYARRAKAHWNKSAGHWDPI